MMIVKSSQFGKIAKQAGRNKRAGRKYFSDSLNEQADNLKAGWQIRSENLSEHALLLGTSEYSKAQTGRLFVPNI